MDDDKRYRVYNDIERCIKDINEKHIKHIAINEVFYGSGDISFLGKCPLVEDVLIYSEKIVNLDVLYEMPNLNALTISPVIPKNGIDLSRLHLESFRGNWSKRIRGLEHATSIKILHLTQYKEQDLNKLSSLTSLVELHLTQGTLISLEGIENFADLQELELYGLRKLETLGLSKKNANLVKLDIESCKKIHDSEKIAELGKLENLNLTHLGEIRDVKFVRNLKHLRHFTFLDTIVLDGDLYPCENIRYVQFLNRRHYTHSNDDFSRRVIKHKGGSLENNRI
ncbi:hypothetical protein [Terribacillus saccharophilus]|uniref:hypothetical protein n=1 Tax=Terribacillus saccharophilus TaxID=361277 RepID=UPI002DC3E005|nr:hypothetical protein [Terribacillus saccharophilus]MEC0289164.1 hypothetical protein [Terribacillus saccharophilus]